MTYLLFSITLVLVAISHSSLSKKANKQQQVRVLLNGDIARLDGEVYAIKKRIESIEKEFHKEVSRSDDTEETRLV